MDINDNVISKAALWADRIHAFQKSGLSRKDWCQQNEISQSTLGYWIRKIQSEIPETGPAVYDTLNLPKKSVRIP